MHLYSSGPHVLHIRLRQSNHIYTSNSESTMYRLSGMHYVQAIGDALWTYSSACSEETNRENAYQIVVMSVLAY